MAFRVNQDGLLIDDATPTPGTPGISSLMGQPPPQAPAVMTPPPTGGLPMPAPAPSMGPPHVPQDPDARGALWRNLLADFTWSLGAGASASANAPPGQRNVAAFGAAMTAPFQRRAAEQKLKLEAAQSAERSAEAQRFLAMIGQANTALSQKDQALDITRQTAQSEIAKRDAEIQNIYKMLPLNILKSQAEAGNLNAKAALDDYNREHPAPTVVAPGASVLPGSAARPAEGTTPQPVTPIFTSPATPPTPSEDERINQLGIKKANGTITPDEQKELAVRTQTKLAVPTLTGNNMRERQDTVAGRKEVMDRYNDLNGAQSLLKSMNDAAERINSGKSTAIGADDMILLSNHIAMTMGQVKGARTGQQMIEEHKRARDLPSDLQTIVDGWRNGSQLSGGQRQEFIRAANDRLKSYKEQYDQAKEVWDYEPKGERNKPPAPPQSPAAKPPATGVPQGAQRSKPSDF